MAISSKKRRRRAARHKLDAHDRGENRHNKGLARILKERRQEQLRTTRGSRPPSSALAYRVP